MKFEPIKVFFCRRYYVLTVLDERRITIRRFKRRSRTKEESLFVFHLRGRRWVSAVAQPSAEERFVLTAFQAWADDHPRLFATIQKLIHD